MTLTTTQASALVELRERGTLRPSNRSFSKWDGRRTFARRTLQALVDAGHAEWRKSVRGTRLGPVTYDGFITPKIEEPTPASGWQEVGFLDETTTIEEPRMPNFAALAPKPTETVVSAKTFRTGYMDRALDALPEIVERAKEDLADVDFDTIVGTGFSGAVVIPSLANALGKNFVLIRKDEDDSHHGGGRLLGTLGQRWIFVDDFISSGKTKRRVLDKIAVASLPDPGSWGDKTRVETTYVGDYVYVCFNDKPFTPAEEARVV